MWETFFGQFFAQLVEVQRNSVKVALRSFYERLANCLGRTDTRKVWVSVIPPNQTQECTVYLIGGSQPGNHLPLGYRICFIAPYRFDIRQVQPQLFKRLRAG